MALSKEQFGKLREQGLTVDQIIRFEKGEKPQRKESIPERFGGKFLGGLGVGALKGLGTTLVGGANLAQKAGEKISQFATGKKLREKQRFQPPVTKEQLKPVGVAQKIGFGAEQVGEFLLPSKGILKAESLARKGIKGARILQKTGQAGSIAQKILPLLSRSLIEGVALGGQRAIQEGEFNKDVRTTALIGAAFPILGAGFRAVKKGITAPLLKKTGQKVQQVVIRPTARDFKDGFKIDNIAKHKVGGSLNQVVERSNIKLNTLGKQLNATLKETGDDVAIDLGKISRLTAEKLTKDKAQFGTAKGIKRILGELDDEVLAATNNTKVANLFDATQIKRGAGTKGAWSFGRVEPDANATEQVYSTFYRLLRDEINKKAPKSVQGFNKQISELIPISNAALRRLPVEQRNNVISLTDSLGLYAAIFDPSALALIGASKLSKSGRFGNFLVKAAEKMATESPRSLIAKRIFGQ